MRNAASMMSFLLALLWVSTAFAKDAAGAFGISTPEPSMLLYAASGLLPIWWLFRRK